MIADNKKDLLWMLIVSVIILLWASIPTWVGYQTENSELRFRGIYYDSQDYAVHIAAMEAGRHGEWAYQFRFTTETHHPAYVRMFYIVLGHFSKWLGLGAEFTFALARWILGLTALFALYKLMRQIFPDPFWGRIAFLMAALGSGIGWLQLILNWTPGPITPIDFWLVDDYVFFSLSVFPHFSFVTTGMCIVLSLWLDFLKRPQWINVAGIGLAAILVQFVNPIAFATLNIGLLGAAILSWWKHQEISRQDIWALLLIAVAQLPLLAYNFIILNNDPLWSQFTAQNKTLSPPPSYYLWGFAFFWPFAILGTIMVLRTKLSEAGAAVAWAIAGFLLAYIPVYIQRRFLQNITIPLAILATVGLMKLFETGIARIPGIIRWRSSLGILFVFLTSISSIQISLGQMAYLQTHPENLYYPARLDHAVDWLSENAQYNDFVLASEQTSQILAQKAGLRAYFGHEMETLDYKTKQSEVQEFFQGGFPKIAGKPIKWIVYGPLEKELGPDFQPTDNLELVYDVQGVQIYEVR